MAQPVLPILYKYMPARRMDFFSAPKLRFTPPDEFNDLFDCKLRTKGICREDYLIQELRDHIELQYEEVFRSSLAENTGFPRSIFDRTITPQLAMYLKKYLSPIIFQNLENIRIHIKNIIDPQLVTAAAEKALRDANVGILCLAQDKKNTVMWGNYATGVNGKDNCGFVVGFDTSHRFFHRKINEADKLRHLVSVAYPKKRSMPYMVDYNEKHYPLDALVHDLLYTKDFRWAYEEEWRMLVASPQTPEQPVSGLEEVPIEMIKNIYLGARSESYLQAAALAFCRQHAIPLFRMVPTVNGVLEPEPISLF